ncbi:MAG: site-2 protease family protein [Bryobacterales bacterium]|nr:site-2 protease family protein [Bryobacterales bacterium]
MQIENPLPVPPAPPPSGNPSASRKKWGALGTLGVLLFKFKGFVLLALTKGKLVLLGLTKLNTLLSMLASIGVYWLLYGWKFGLGFVLSIYVHEMGHVMALARYGIPASAPMFIPFFGAFIRLKAYPATAGEDARVGLAGPLWGLGAALACMGIWQATGSGLFAALARVGAWINVFNLIPIWQLDGGRGFRALTRHHRMLIAALSAVLWMWTSETMLIVVAIASVWRCFTKDTPGQPDDMVFYQFAGLLAALAAVYAVTAGPAQF